MALVLRKAFSPKNASILKCIKGRPLTTAPNRKHTAALLHNHMKRSLGKKTQRFNLTTYSKLRDIQENSQASAPRQLYKSPSSPCLALSTVSNGPSADCLPRSYSDHLFHKVAPGKLLVKFQRRTFSTECSDTEKGQASPGFIQGLEAICACPCPCPGNCCLPPPCNTPPKCLQYMTGYYYYPYGTWFCGPYHVSTGPCGPCTGPVVPGGPCGPCGPCPGGPCGPPGLSCACICGVGSHNHMASNMSNNLSPNAQFVPFGMQGMYPNTHAFNSSIQYSYDPQPSFSPYPADSLPWEQQSMPGPNMPGPNMPNPNMPSPNMPSPFFGPGINVPITPIPINAEPCGPIIPRPNPSIPSSPTPTPRSSVRINPTYMKEARSGASPYGSKPRPMPTRPPMPSSKSSVYFSKTHPTSRPISTAQDPCSSNLTPKPLRQSPPSRYDTICALSRNNPFTKPRVNSRMMSRPEMIQTCYYSTRSMKKYVASAEIKSLRKLHRKHRQAKVSSIKISQAEKLEEVNSKPLCYWCLLCDKNSCPCQHCSHSTVAQKRLPMTGIISMSSQISERHNEEQFEKKTDKHCDWI